MRKNGHSGLHKAPAKEENERLRGEGDKFELLILDSVEGNLKDTRKDEEGKTFHKLHVLVMNDDL